MVLLLILQMGRVPGLRAVSECLLTELKTRFAYVTDNTSTNFDPIYLIATFLDPQLKQLVPDDLIATINRSFFNATRWFIDSKLVFLIYRVT